MDMKPGAFQTEQTARANALRLEATWCAPARVTGAESARGRVERHAVIEEMGLDGVRRALRTGEVFRFSVSKKGSLWKVLSRKGTWSDIVMLN